MSDTFITIRISDDLRESLATIARHTQRSKSSLIHEAITRYVETTGGIIEALRAGGADAKAGRVVNGDEEARFRAMVDCMAGEELEREGVET